MEKGIEPQIEKKSSLSHKINLASSIPVVLISIIMSIVSIIIFLLSMSNSSAVYNSNIKELNLLQQFSENYLQTRVNLLRMQTRTTTAEITSDQQQLNKYRAGMQNNLVQLQKLASHSPDAQKDYKQLQNAVKQYDTVTDARLQLALNRNTDALNASTQTAWNTYNILDNAISSLTSSANHAAHMRLTGNTVLMIVGIILIVACVLSGILLSRRFSRKISTLLHSQLGKITHAARQLAMGKLEMELDTEDTSELGVLARAFEDVRQTLTNMKADVDTLIDGCNRGDLSVQVDTSRHDGIYRDITEGILDIFTIVNVSIESATDTLSSLANGEHIDPIPTDDPGVFGVMSNSMETIRQVITSLHADAVELATAGMEGDLSARGDASRYHGIYAEILEGINLAFQNIQEPMDVVIERLTTLAAGGHISRDNLYKGYPAKLINSLNLLGIALETLQNESNRLAEAGAVGDLETRGDTSQLQGRFADILTGFNNTLDNILTPLHEIRSVLSGIQKHDFAATVDGTYQGAMADLASDINAVHSHFLMIETIFVKLSKGDTSSLEAVRQVGRYCEADELTPAVAEAIQSIRNLITEATGLAQAAKDGDLSKRADDTQFFGGYKEIILGMNNTMEAFSTPIHELIAILDQLSAGNLDLRSTLVCTGAYQQMQDALNHSIDSFNDLLRNVQIAASEVSAGSRQVSEASQALSQSSTEQASAVEQVTASVAELSAQTRENAEKSSKANLLATETSQHADDGNTSMQEMLQSIEDIGTSAKNISKIIKTIDDIAFQTNILALNAAVEAARAGQYGKGFTVVADEVRNLATKSANAAHETAELIETSIQKVQAGTEIAGRTAEKFSVITTNTAQVAELLHVIGQSSNQQADAITQVDLSVQQISMAVQNNSATSEETAASSEELSGQAQMLLDSVSSFHLRQ